MLKRKEIDWHDDEVNDSDNGDEMLVIFMTSMIKKFFSPDVKVYVNDVEDVLNGDRINNDDDIGGISVHKINFNDHNYKHIIFIFSVSISFSFLLIEVLYL